jgi:hypothetical protein
MSNYIPLAYISFKKSKFALISLYILPYLLNIPPRPLVEIDNLDKTRN